MTVQQEGRRAFLTAAAATAGSLFALLGAAKVAGVAETELPPLSEGVIFPDPALCVGCGACEVACGQVHREAGLSGVPRIHVFAPPGAPVGIAIATGAQMGNAGYLPSPCKQCPDPECFVVCPADALRIDGRVGARFIDESVCVACGKCEASCPFPAEGVLAVSGEAHAGTRIFYDPDLHVYTKCDMCHWRSEGPACVGACPVNHAIQLGLIASDHLCLDIRRSDEVTYRQIL
ncbi:4Fe-4S dicluster domain-containing protein [Symbiobacterium terraclitae]|uniref:4Fe-4S dicluster domain-containing protein n=1 Tax=Symbiobacterium terraclitae TaxID=557451 RepID=UPI0035B5253A